MFRKKHITASCVAISLALVFTRCAHSGSAAPDLAKYDQIVVVGTNDFHGYLRPWVGKFAGEKIVSGGAEWFGGHVEILKKHYGDHLVLLDAGDIFQGTMESNHFKGRSTLAYYNLMPYRAAAIGNHEFDYGPLERGGKDRLGTLKARIGEAKFPFVQANIYWKGTDQLWKEKNLHPSVMITAAGHKIGVIGLTTPTTPVKTLPMNVEKLDYRALAPAALAEAQALRAHGAELVLLTTHEGGQHPGEPIYELLHALPRGTIDAVVAGHTHTEIHEFVNDVPVIESVTRGVFFGRIDLFVEKATGKVNPALTKISGMHPICGVWFANYESCDTKFARDLIAAGQAKESDFAPFRTVTYEGEEVKPDLAVRAALAPYFRQVDKTIAEVLGEVRSDFQTYPSGETQMGSLFLRAFHWKYPQAKAIYLNGGGIRRPFLKGPMRYSDLFEVHPFDNYVTLARINGKQLRSLVQVGVSGAQKIPAIWGIRATYHTGYRPEYERDVNGDGKKDGWERNRLVSLTWDDGKPVNDSEEFWIATIDFLVTGGDNSDVAFGSLPSENKKFLEESSRDPVAEYLRAHKGIKLPLENDQMRFTAIP